MEGGLVPAGPPGQDPPLGMTYPIPQERVENNDLLMQSTANNRAAMAFTTNALNKENHPTQRFNDLVTAAVRHEFSVDQLQRVVQSNVVQLGDFNNAQLSLTNNMHRLGDMVTGPIQNGLDQHTEEIAELQQYKEQTVQHKEQIAELQQYKKQVKIQAEQIKNQAELLKQALERIQLLEDGSHTEIGQKKSDRRSRSPRVDKEADLAKKRAKEAERAKKDADLAKRRAKEAKQQEEADRAKRDADLAKRRAKQQEEADRVKKDAERRAKEAALAKKEADRAKHADKEIADFSEPQKLLFGFLRQYKKNADQGRANPIVLACQLPWADPAIKQYQAQAAGNRPNLTKDALVVSLSMCTVLCHCLSDFEALAPMTVEQIKTWFQIRGACVVSIRQNKFNIGLWSINKDNAKKEEFGLIDVKQLEQFAPVSGGVFSPPLRGVATECHVNHLSQKGKPRQAGRPFVEVSDSRGRSRAPQRRVASESQSEQAEPSESDPDPSPSDQSEDEMARLMRAPTQPLDFDQDSPAGDPEKEALRSPAQQDDASPMRSSDDDDDYMRSPKKTKRTKKRQSSSEEPVKPKARSKPQIKATSKRKQVKPPAEKDVNLVSIRLPQVESDPDPEPESEPQIVLPMPDPEPARDNSPKRKKRAPVAAGKVCCACNATQTSMWRKINGQTACNACWARQRRKK